MILGNQWWRPFTACLVDYGLVQFAVTNLALFTLGAEAEAVLGTNSFLAIYVLSAAAGVLATVALDPNTVLTVGGSNAMMGVFGAMCVYSLLNIEPDWNKRGCALRSLCVLVVVTALVWLAALPTIGGEHVVGRETNDKTNHKTKQTNFHTSSTL